MADERLWVPGHGSRPDAIDADVKRALTLGREGVKADPSVDEMRINRTANAARAGGAGLTLSMGRPRDPMVYWERNNLPYKIDNEEEMRKIRQYCNTPDAPVWMGDYSFKPMGEIVAGDEVIGWEWRQSQSGRWKSHLVRTPVLAVQDRLAPEIVRVTMESGRVIRCTPDHLWANPLHSPAMAGSAEYRTAKVGQSLRHVIEPTADLTSEKDRLMAAWLGGLYDGEGTGERIAQDQDHNPDVCQRIEETLDHLGLPWTRSASTYNIRHAGGAQGRTKARQHIVNFLNWGGVTRRQTTALDSALLTSNFGSQDKIASIESEGPGRVISMQTGTGNYTAWGYASKNCRLLYLTHPLIASAIDIYSKYPLTGMELNCKDPALTDFYSDLFLDQLDYEEFLVLVLREYWSVGEAWPFGSFNDTLGVWEDDELVNPDDVRVTKSAFQRDPRFEMKLPETLRTIIQNKEPVWEYEALMRSYPELQHFMGENTYMPVSNTLLQQLAFKAHTFHPRGIPILMRGMRAIVQEEMLNAAQDAISERLSTPLILAKLGASATDLGTNTAWVPTPADLQAFEDSLDSALAADFRVLTHHFAVDVSHVFGKEIMPDFSADFERLGERQLQVFGMSKTMLSGAQGGETYAADAMNRDLVSQLLGSAQRLVKRLVRQRMLVVAEAQEHFDYEVRGGRRYPIMEEVLEVDSRTGEQRIVEQPKLLVPDLQIKAMDIRRETEFRDFVEKAVEAGVPISQKSRFVNVPIDLEEEQDAVVAEVVAKAVAEQEARKQTYLALLAKKLPIPADLVKDFGPQAQQDPATEGIREATPHIPGETIPQIDSTQPHPALVPTLEDQAEEDKAEGSEPGDKKLPRNLIGGEGRTRPPESDEQRKGMPVAAARAGWGTVEPLIFKEAQTGDDGEVIYEPVTDEQERPIIGRLTHGPAHVGMRRFSVVTAETDLDGDPEDDAVPPLETPTEEVS